MKEKTTSTERPHHNRLATALIILTNLLFVAGIIVASTFFTSNYRHKINDQNVGEITNVNASSARVASTFLEYQNKTVDDQVLALTTGSETTASKTMTLSEALKELGESNSRLDSHYELVGTNSKGTAVALKNGAVDTLAVDYSTGYDSFKQIFTETDPGGVTILCTAEFTDYYTKYKSFALYRHVDLIDSSSASGKSTYTLLLVFQSSKITSLLDSDSGFSDLASVIVKNNGDYLFGSTEFLTDNLFKYFRDYNGLTFDEKNALANEFLTQSKMTFYYNDSKDRPCIFITAPLSVNEDWRSVTVVPLSSYHNTNTDLWLTITIIGLLILLALFDITWMVIANRRLSQSIAKEKEASKAKNDFLSRMSHDIRTPLNVVIGNTILAQREKNPPATTQYLDDIATSGKFLLSLVNDILDLNKVESRMMELHPEPYTLAALGESLHAIIVPLATAKSQSFTITGCSSKQAYLLDPIRMNQIFFNILSNSVKFTPQGRSISLDCVVVPNKNGPTDLIFTAKDDGTGMSPEFQEKMFDPFTQENEGGSKVQGTGLGLAIVHNLVELMGGSIHVDSAPDKGTTMIITIPAMPTDQKPKETVILPPANATIPQTGKRILLCEDNDLNANIAMTLLKDKGYLVERAADGQKGSDLFEVSPVGYYDLILMDMRMPIMDGLVATKIIRSLPRPDAKSVPIVAMTANAYQSDIENCLAAGMNAHLSKPIDPEKMFGTIAHFLAVKPEDK